MNNKRNRWLMFFLIIFLLVIVALVIQVHIVDGASTPIFDYYFPVVEHNLGLPTPAPTMPVGTPMPYPTPQPTPSFP
jgi:hypothetical protein